MAVFKGNGVQYKVMYVHQCSTDHRVCVCVFFLAFQKVRLSVDRTKLMQ